MVAGKQPDQQWNAADAGQRDGVGQIHRGHGRPAAGEKAGSTSLSSTPPREAMKQSVGSWSSAKPLTAKDTKAHQGFGPKVLLRVPSCPLWLEVLNGFRLRVGSSLAQPEILQHAHAFFQQRRTLRNLAVGRKFVDQHRQQLCHVGADGIG